MLCPTETKTESMLTQDLLECENVSFGCLGVVLISEVPNTAEKKKSTGSVQNIIQCRLPTVTPMEDQHILTEQLVTLSPGFAKVFDKTSGTQGSPANATSQPDGKQLNIN